MICDNPTGGISVTQMLLCGGHLQWTTFQTSTPLPAFLLPPRAMWNIPNSLVALNIEWVVSWISLGSLFSVVLRRVRVFVGNSGACGLLLPQHFPPFFPSSFSTSAKHMTKITVILLDNTVSSKEFRTRTKEDRGQVGYEINTQPEPGMTCNYRIIGSDCWKESQSGPLYTALSLHQLQVNICPILCECV